MTSAEYVAQAREGKPGKRSIPVYLAFQVAQREQGIKSPPCPFDREGEDDCRDSWSWASRGFPKGDLNPPREPKPAAPVPGATADDPRPWWNKD